MVRVRVRVYCTFGGRSTRNAADIDDARIRPSGSSTDVNQEGIYKEEADQEGIYEEHIRRETDKTHQERRGAKQILPLSGAPELPGVRRGRRR
jgi:hypothetical protein